MKKESRESGKPEVHPCVVVGEGWAALACVGLLGRAGQNVTWVLGSRSRLVPVLPSLEASPGAQGWRFLSALYGVECGDLVSGNFLREFRNKSFRPPLWIKAPTPKARREVRELELWKAELNLGSDFEARFSTLPLSEIDEALRAAIGALPSVERIEGESITALTAIDEKQAGGTVIRLSSGREILCQRLYYADRWAELRGVTGLPKPLPFLRGRELLGVVQLQLTHSRPWEGPWAEEGFFGPIQREAGEEQQRQVWGHFTRDGCTSHWSVALTAAEMEDNHEVAKKIRRMKQALDKMFAGVEGWGEPVPSFASTIVDEQVRCEENLLFEDSQTLREAQVLSRFPQAYFLTDGYGPAAAFEQAFRLLAPEVDLSAPLTAEWEQVPEVIPEARAPSAEAPGETPA